MRTIFPALRERPDLCRLKRISNTICRIGVLALAGHLAVYAQAPQPQSPAPTSPVLDSAAPAPNSAPENTAATNNAVVEKGDFTIQTTGGEIKEDQLRQLLVGKTLYLRGGYLDNNLEFDDHGRLISRSARGSFTLSQIQINKVKLSKRKLELEGDRYALHFLGAAPYDDPTSATDRVKITPRKKEVRITFNREEVEKAKKEKKDKHKDKKNGKQQNNAPLKNAAPEADEDADTPPAQVASATEPAPLQGQTTDQMAMDRRDKKHRSEDKKAATATSSANASQQLMAALDSAFSRGIDERMIEKMPDFWRLYYQAAAAKVDYKPTEPGVLRQSMVDQKAKLVSAIDPPSNEFAQANAITGVALYHVVIGSDGRAEKVVAGRPIGFGLDESADQTIRKAVFQPAIKDGKPVPVALDLVVSFRIYSKRTSQTNTQQATEKKPDERILPGPYTVRALAQNVSQGPQPAPQQDQPQPAPAAQPDASQPQPPADPSAQPAQSQPQQTPSSPPQPQQTPPSTPQ